MLGHPKYYIKPYEIAEAIAKLPQGASGTLTQLQIDINSDLSTALPFPCPACGGMGLLSDGSEDPVCFGYGSTKTLVTITSPIYQPQQEYPTIAP